MADSNNSNENIDSPMSTDIKTKKKGEIDMTNGPLFGKILMFAIPLIFSSVLQLLFNAADVVVVGRYAGKEALAAVGSTGALVNLLTNLFIGLSVGANVLFARYIGGNQEKEASEALHTAIWVSVCSGFLLAVMGFFLSKPLLILMDTPDDVIELSAIYLKIYFMGMPAMLFYNFGSALLRAVGDTKRPLIFLTLAGIINVILNLIFVIPLQMSVKGVALATIISQFVSACLLLGCLLKGVGACKLMPNQLKISPVQLKKILSIGIPAGIQSVIFSISNVLIQSSVNSFGSIAMAGNSAAANIEGFVYVSMNSFYQTALSFTSQNLGAKQYKRIGKILLSCQICVIFTGVVMGNLCHIFSTPLISLYNNNPDVISYGKLRIQYICTIYCFCGIMDVFTGTIRGLGYSIMPTIVSLLGACAFRVVWIMTVFQSIHSLPILYLSYPISWVLTFTTHFICFCIVYKKLMRNN